MKTGLYSYIEPPTIQICNSILYNFYLEREDKFEQRAEGKDTIVNGDISFGIDGTEIEL